MDTRAASAAFEFETRRFQIGPLSEGDADIYCRLYTEEPTMRFVGPPLSPERALRSFRAAVRVTTLRPVVQLFLSIRDKNTRRAVGVCSIPEVNEQRSAAAVGIMLISDTWGHGAATEILSHLIAHAFFTLRLEWVWAEIPKPHIAAQRLVTRVGFEWERDLPSTRGSWTQTIWSTRRSRTVRP